MDIKEYKDIVLLREVVARELETISQYEAASMEATDEKLRLFFSHLAKEEKEHVSEAVALLHEFDAEQRKEWEEKNTSEEHFRTGVHHPVGERAGANEPRQEESASTPIEPEKKESPTTVRKGRWSELTVGSLIKR